MRATDVSSLHEHEVIHGVHVPDPYRWLEDRSLPATEQWIRTQEQRCTRYFNECTRIAAIQSRVRDALDVPSLEQPVRVGTRCFYRRRGRGEEQACIYVRDTMTSEERLLVSRANLFDSIRIHCVSPCGMLLAYELRHGGTDCRTIHVVDVEDGTELDTSVAADWFRGLVFCESLRGFFYCQDDPDGVAEHTIRWHGLDGLGSDDVCLRVPRTESSRLVLSCDEIHIGVTHIHGRHPNAVLDFWIASLHDALSWHRVFASQPLPFCPVLTSGRIFAKTHIRAPRGRYAEFDHQGHELRTVIPELPGKVRQVMVIQDGFLVNHLHQRQSEVRWWTLDGAEHTPLHLPKNGTITLLPPLAGAQPRGFASCESFDSVPTIYEVHVASGTVKPWSEQAAPGLLDPVHIQQRHYRSYDGTIIPLTLLSLRPTDEPQPVPCMMTAYGGFGVPATPQFSVLIRILMELGATIAVPQIRGGGDRGTEWHEAGRGRQRQVAIHDFLAAGDWLKKVGYAGHDVLAIFGGSNGGLLIGAAITQRPDLFRAALCIAPLLDMVRYERFDRAARWSEEYGTVRNEADFRALYDYSPYHHVSERIDYPATLFVTGDSDDRCNPAHVRKMAAALQNREAQSHPILVEYSAERGHMPVLPLSVRVTALAQRIAFFCRELELTIPTSW